LALAPPLQFVGRFVAGVKAAADFQRFDNFAIAIDTLGLADFLVPVEAEPAQILANALDLRLA
jgi:hypothetical protein